MAPERAPPARHLQPRLLPTCASSRIATDAEADADAGAAAAAVAGEEGGYGRDQPGHPAGWLAQDMSLMNPLPTAARRYHYTAG